jgi:hypothetical protein
MKQLSWLLTAAIAAYACQLAVHHATPIDAALPFIAVVVTLVAAASYPSTMLAVPLLIAAEIAIPVEGMRLLAFGIVLAATFAFAMTRRRGSVALAFAAIFLLRWIPFSDVHLGRELFLLAIAALIVLVLDRTPFAIALAVIVVLITPAIPMRTLLLPLAMLFVAIMAKVFGMPKVTLQWPSTIAIAFALLFFAWSGVVARAFPYFLKRATVERERFAGAPALPANASVTLQVPPGATSLIVSGANVSHMMRGTALGTIDPGGRIIRIGDAADWGYLRRENFYGTRNPLPRDPAGKLRGFGYAAWVDGAGRIPLPPNVRAIRITAAALPRDASLQVEGFE